MRCLALASNYTFNMDLLEKHLAMQGEVTRFGDVLQTSSHGEIFYFGYGVVVCWELDRADEMAIVGLMREFKDEQLGATARDVHHFEYGSEPRVVNEVIYLPDEEVTTKLAASFALAQSVKLTGFEIAIQQTTQMTRDIPLTLAKKGKINLSRKDIRHLMGQILLDRNAINLHMEMLYKPRYFWSHADLEPIYEMTRVHLDIHDRVKNLNQRLAVMHELFDMLAAELNNQHSALLEWIIITLISVEIILVLSRDVFHLI